MPYKNNYSTAIIIALSVIALALIAAVSFNHSYTAFAAPKKGGGGSTSTKGPTLGGGPSSSATSTTNSNVLTKKELSSFTSCINTANKSQGLTHKVVTDCLDTARGITSASSSSTGTTKSSSPPSIAPSVNTQT
jgi:hypothetical protein